MDGHELAFIYLQYGLSTPLMCLATGEVHAAVSITGTGSEIKIQDGGVDCIEKYQMEAMERERQIARIVKDYGKTLYHLSHLTSPSPSHRQAMYGIRTSAIVTCRSTRTELAFASLVPKTNGVVAGVFCLIHLVEDTLKLSLRRHRSLLTGTKICCMWMVWVSGIVCRLFVNRYTFWCQAGEFVLV